jgi:anti-sigma factor RsiW
MFMKAFEEKYTAWMDGRLSEGERQAFERELEAHPELGGLVGALADREHMGQIGRVLREGLESPVLGFPEVFNQQLMDRIAREETAELAVSQRHARRWRLSWLALAGTTCLLMAGGLFKWMIPKSQKAPQYLAQITSVRTGDPSIWATPVYNPNENLTLLWIEGLDYLPENYSLQ